MPNRDGWGGATPNDPMVLLALRVVELAVIDLERPFETKRPNETHWRRYKSARRFFLNGMYDFYMDIVTTLHPYCDIGDGWSGEGKRPLPPPVQRILNQ